MGILIYFESDISEKKLIIKDNGVGISSQDINRVFERGFTGNIGRRFSKSTGMSLYLAQKMAMKLGHSISIASIEGEYTKVIIYFSKAFFIINFNRY